LAGPTEHAWGAKELVVGLASGGVGTKSVLRDQILYPDCHHNAVIDPSDFPNEITFNDLQPRMVFKIRDHRSANLRTAFDVP
jgi:hypothetical protein